MNGVRGIILVPDQWDGLYTFSVVNTYGEGFAINTIPLSDWTLLESLGCVFLPAAGIREEVKVTQSSEGGKDAHGHYWTSTYNNKKGAFYFHLCSKHLRVNNSDSPYKGYAVRLVKNAN